MNLAAEEISPALIAEMDGIVKDYYRKTEASSGVPPIDFDWSLYESVAATGMQLILTARDEDGALCGYALYFVMRHPHHDFTIANCDTLAVDLAHRGQGVGSALCSYAQAVLAGRGVSRMAHGSRHVYGDKDPLFTKLGFRPEETIYVKDI